MSGRTRLMKEMKESARDGDPTIALAPDGENLYRWSATLRRSNGSVTSQRATANGKSATELATRKAQNRIDCAARSMSRG